jgi:hypothetical protein
MRVEGPPLKPGRQDTVAGPVVFYGLRDAASPINRQAFSRRSLPRGQFAAWKAVTEVKPGVAARVVIPQRERDRFLLLYDPRHFHGPEGYHQFDGTAVVRFGPCPPSKNPHRSLAFNGGFLVSKPGCYEVDVYANQSQTPARRRVNFATPRSRCRGT